MLAYSLLKQPVYIYAKPILSWYYVNYSDIMSSTIFGKLNDPLYFVQCTSFFAILA